MSTAYQNCGSQKGAVPVSYSYCDSIPVLAHATDHYCKYNWRVVGEIPGEPIVARISKFFHALKTTRCKRSHFAVAKKVDQESVVFEQIEVSIILLFQILFSSSSGTSSKEFSSPTEQSFALGD